jgi:hypothetical protein
VVVIVISTSVQSVRRTRRPVVVKASVVDSRGRTRRGYIYIYIYIYITRYIIASSTVVVEPVVGLTTVSIHVYMHRERGTEGERRSGFDHGVHTYIHPPWSNDLRGPSQHRGF